MRVICINDQDDADSAPATPYDPEVGDILTVKGTIVGYGISGKPYDCYMFKEIPDDYIYAVKDFAPLSEIDETEFERNYNKELS